MAKEIYIDQERLKQGLYALEDTTKAPFGSARIMQNMRVTDKGGVSPRLGTLLLGTANASALPIRGLYSYRKSNGENEILIKSYDDEIEAYSRDHSSAGWFKLKDGFTSDQEFGFVTSLVNTEDEDYVIFCNRYEPYQRWTGAVTLLNGALVGGETTVTVDSTLNSETYESKTATGSSATTLTVSSATWTADQWIGFYVYITSGVHIGKIRRITDNDGTILTFDTLGSDPGSCTFQIRRLAFPATGTLIYGGTTVAYTAVPTATGFTVASAHAAADNTPVTLVPTEYTGLPRGNRLTNYLNRVIVGNVRSAIGQDGSGNKFATAAGGSYFVSKINNPFDFGFTAGSRVAGDGDIVAAPYGGGNITDVAHQENTAYVFKRRYIEAMAYTQDANDIAQREPLKAEVGSVGRVIKGANDIYFMTEDRKLTSIGRVAGKDLKPQTENIGYPIKRILDEYNPDEFNGIEFEDRIYFSLKSDDSVEANNVTVVYNKVTDAFDGVWDIGANNFAKFDSKLYFGDSTGANVYQMNVGHADISGETRFPIPCSYASHYMNLTPSKANLQALNSVFFEGYILGNSTITFKLWKDFSTEAFLEFDFTGSETAFLQGSEIHGSLGLQPIGLKPLGSISDASSDGMRHFQFRVYFPFQYANFFSVGWSSAEEDIDYEIIRYGLGLREDVSLGAARIKSV